jgi:hypothetical protein
VLPGKAVVSIVGELLGISGHRAYAQVHFVA